MKLVSRFLKSSCRLLGRLIARQIPTTDMCLSAYPSLDQNLLESRVSLVAVALIARTKPKSRVLITGNAISFHECSRDEVYHDESCKLLYNSH